MSAVSALTTNVQPTLMTEFGQSTSVWIKFFDFC